MDRGSLYRKLTWFFATIGAVIVAYFAVPSLVLLVGINAIMLPSVPARKFLETRHDTVTVGGDREVLIRQFGRFPTRNCVLFFPGQHGNIEAYEDNLYRLLNFPFSTTFAMTYPGQDGAGGSASLDTLSEDMAKAIRFLVHNGRCDMRNTIFVGRSFGASVAIIEAAAFHPHSVLVDGLSPDLPSAVRTWMRRRPITRMWQWLPLEHLLPSVGDVRKALDGWRDTPIVVFQGTDDRVTPFDDAKALMAGRPYVQFIPVEGAGHDTTYVVGKDAYRSVFISMLRTPWSKGR